MTSTQTLTFFQLLLEIATSSRRSFVGYHFTGEANLRAPMLRAMLVAHQETFPFDSDTNRFRIAPGEALQFSDCDFSHGTLIGWDLEEAQLVRTDLRHATLRNCVLRRCTFEKCSGYQVSIDDACILEETRFTACDLTRAHIGGTWQGCTLKDCTLLSSTAHVATFRDSCFTASTLSGSTLFASNFPGTQFVACEWKQIDIWGCDFKLAQFTNIREIIGGILLEDAILGEASPQEKALRQMAAYYVQHNQGPCWGGFIRTFASYPGMLAWAYQVLSPYACLKEHLESYKECTPAGERALIEQWEQQKA